MSNALMIDCVNSETLMSVKSAAEVLRKDESTIRKIGKELFPESFKNGIKTYLNEKQVTAIKLNLGKNSELPKTDLEKELIIHQAMIFQAEKIKSMQMQIDEMKPKAELADMAIRDEREHYSITDAGKHMGLSRSKMFAVLREYGLITKENLPTQKAINKKILQLRSNPNCNGRNRPQAIMTMENIFNFTKEYL